MIHAKSGLRGGLPPDRLHEKAPVLPGVAISHEPEQNGAMGDTRTRTFDPQLVELVL